MNLRKCVSCGRQYDKLNFIRISKTRVDDSGVVIRVSDVGDSTYIEGRSAYLCPTEKCFVLARKKSRIEKSLKCAISSEVYDKIKRFIDLKNVEDEENAYTC